LLGPLALFFIAAYILRDAHPPLSLPSLVYFGTLVITVVMRLFDIEFLGGTTLGGHPARIKHWVTYALFTAFAATLAWGVIQYIIWSEQKLSVPARERPERAW